MLPYVVVPSQVFGVIDLFVFIVLATMWNLLAGYGGMVSVGQQAYIGIGAYGLVYLADQLGVNAFLAVPRRRSRRRDRPPGVLPRVPVAGRLLRDRHLGDRRGRPAGHGAGRRPGRRFRRLAAQPRRHRPRPARRLHVLVRARRRDGRGGRHVPADALPPGDRTDRDPRRADRRGEQRSRGHPGEAARVRGRRGGLRRWPAR